MIVTEAAQQGFAGSVIALPSAGSAPLVSLAFLNHPFFRCLHLSFFLGLEFGIGGLRLPFYPKAQGAGTDLVLASALD